ncbi:transcriptional regulator [Streptomyces sp. NBC_01537]|uniref:helix-turn-helix transcriptional regulator n=1 Tax=Streptomyces sp. NBC_01537 TaxID=2903896 RepID=UPI00386644B0
MTTPDPDPEQDPAPEANGRWTFLTNHARVLLELARQPDARLRDVAVHAGITERAAQGIVADLVAGGYLTKVRVGRRNRYTINPTGHFRHPAEASHFVGDLLNVFAHDPEAAIE